MLFRSVLSLGWFCEFGWFVSLILCCGCFVADLVWGFVVVLGKGFSGDGMMCVCVFVCWFG